MDALRRAFLKDKFLGDTAWNFVAFSVLASVGVLLNFFIAAYLGARALGVFNQGYAVFVIFGQLAALGIHDSVQKHIAEFSADDPGQCWAIGFAGLVAVLLVAVPIGALLYVLHAAIGVLVDSVDVGLTVAIVAPGVALFAVNKVLLAVLNGRRDIRRFALVQCLRGLSILGCCVFFGVAGFDVYWLAGAFTVAEALILPVLVRFVFFGDDASTRPASETARRVASWIKDHFVFGLRAMPNGFLAESYLRVDVLMLALFVGDTEIGIYSFAAMFIEGLYQVPVVIRTVANPVLVTLVGKSDTAPFFAFARKTAAMGLAAAVLVGGAVWVVFPWLAPLFDGGIVESAEPVLNVLIVGMVLYAAFVPLDHILLQAGRPGRQSILMGGNILINIALNLSLIPLYGIMGAAVATSISYAMSGVTLNIAVRLWLGFRRGLLLT